MGYGYDDDEVDPFIQEILDEISMDAFDAPEPEAPEPETAPAPDEDPDADEDADAEEPYVSPALDDRIIPMPVPGVPLSGSSEAAAHRRLEADRKRAERIERRALGLPDWRTVDTAVSAALAQVLRQGKAGARIRERGSAKGMVIDGEAVLRQAIRGLTAKGISKAAASRAVAERLLER